MPLVDAALAFAVTMLAVATVVTKLVDFLHWLLANGPALLKALLRQFLGERQAMFKSMIDEFLDREYQRIVTRYPLMNTPQLQDDLNQLKAEIKDQNLVHLTGADLVSAVRNSQLWAVIQSDSHLQSDFSNFLRRYSTIETVYTQKFRNNSRKVATSLALILALAFNIDCVTILESYLVKPELSAEVSARSEAVLQNYQSNLAAISSKNSDLAQTFQAARSELKNDLDSLNSQIFPFGWTYFPYGNIPPRSWAKSDPQTEPWRRSWSVWLTWVIGIGFTAALAGLGSPFWYDVIRNLNEMTRGTSQSTTVATTVSSSPEEQPTVAVTQVTQTKSTAPPPNAG